MTMENEGDKTDGEYKFDEGDDMEQLTAHSLFWDNFWQLKARKNGGKCFVLRLKSSFRSQDF